MLKNINKTISLLAAAAAVVSIMPVSANAATKEIKSQEGDIYNAIAYKDGQFYIGGQPNKKDEGAYFFSDGKYKELDNLDSEDKVEVYGTKYAEVKDGEYFLDLSNGKVSDDEIKNKDLDSVGVNLRSNIKYDNDGRYDDTDAKDIKEVTELPKAKFAEGWYAAQYKTKSADTNINGGATSFNVYTDKSGKYIDADYNLGKIKVQLDGGKTANVENTNDADNNVRGAVTDVTVIGQDSSNIYRLATITIKTTNGIAVTGIGGLTLGTATTAFTQSSDKTSVTFQVIQVISKNQYSKGINGIKYARTVTDYIVCDKNGKKIDLLSEDQKAFTVSDGKLINYKLNGNDLDASIIDLKNKSSLYYVELGDDDNITVQDGDNSVDVDVKGNLWALSDDAVSKFDSDGNFDKVYDTDEEYNDLSVYDQDNLIVWNSSDEIYSIISKKVESEDKTDTTTNTGKNTTTNETKAGWVSNNGAWSYINADGSKFKGWFGSDQTWYYLDENGIMVTGWKLVNGQWYYLDTVSGLMKTGWFNDNGKWYYFDASGAMQKNTSIGGYKLDANGVWVG
ncbi:N-acetylmuramoyl-L-alanine amidase family protein [Clostridium saccharoperbutylacetonicum]